MNILAIVVGLFLAATCVYSLFIPHNHQFDWFLALYAALGMACFAGGTYLHLRGRIR